MNIISTNNTIYWTDILLSFSIRKKHIYHTNTTLNEYLSINTDVVIPDDVYPELKYYAIGVGGEPIILDGEFRYNDHSATDVVLRNMIPFVLKPIDSDLTETEQKRYRFRKEITYKGTLYIAYYLKVIEDINARDDFLKITTDEQGKSTLSIFNTKNESLLSPTALNKKVIIENNKTSTFIAKNIKFLFNMTNDDLIELQNVLTILERSETHITELAICSGIDKEEAARVQIAYFAEANINIASKLLTEKPFNLYLEVGSSEPFI